MAEHPHRPLVTEVKACDARALVIRLAECLADRAGHARSFGASDILNNEAQLSAALLSRVGRVHGHVLDFEPKMGSQQFVSSFPLHNYLVSKRKWVRFADFALLDPTRSHAAKSRDDQATHEALAFVEMKYDFVPGAFRGASPLRDLDRLNSFRRFNHSRSKPEGILGVGFRWTLRKGDRDLDGGAVGPKRFRRQQTTFRALEDRLERRSERRWASLVFLDYHDTPTPGVPVVRVLGRHRDVEALVKPKARRVPVQSITMQSTQLRTRTASSKR